jgi:hypothetical protein
MNSHRKEDVALLRAEALLPRLFELKGPARRKAGAGHLIEQEGGLGPSLESPCTGPSSNGTGSSSNGTGSSTNGTLGTLAYTFRRSSTLHHKLGIPVETRALSMETRVRVGPLDQSQNPDILRRAEKLDSRHSKPPSSSSAKHDEAVRVATHSNPPSPSRGLAAHAPPGISGSSFASPLGRRQVGLDGSGVFSSDFRLAGSFLSSPRAVE